MILIKDFETVWKNSAVEKMQHPEGFHDSKFVAWWFAHYNNTDDMYLVYVLYCVIKHNIPLNEFIMVELEKLKTVAVKAQGLPGIMDYLSRFDEK